MSSRKELRARVALLEAELLRERRLHRPAQPNELERLREEVADLQNLVHLNPSKRVAYIAMKRSLTEDGQRFKQLCRRLRLAFHPDKSSQHASVTDVLTKLTAIVNDEATLSAEPQNRPES